MKKIVLFACLCVVMAIGCGRSQQAETPTFTLAWSEYPSWSVFGVAADKGIINGKKGEQSPLEKKYGIDIVLKEADYDACITLYGSGTVDASCQTNIDSLAPSLSRDSVVILPTSTSVGGDACIAVNFMGDPSKPEDVLDFLSKNPTYGLEKSVSEYAFEESVNLLNAKAKKNVKPEFKNMDPAAAAQAMQTGQAKINSIMVWNPFVLQTLRTRDGSKELFNSSTIPEEIIDCVVVSKDSLNKKGGKEFAKAIVEAYYEVCNMLDDKATSDKTYVALGAKFSSLNAADMRKVCEATRFYNTPEKASALMSSKKFQTETMSKVVDFCLKHKMLDKKPTVGFNDPNAQLNFDNSYLK